MNKVPEKLKIYCECENKKKYIDEGICLLCKRPLKNIWPNKEAEKINEIIEYLKEKECKKTDLYASCNCSKEDRDVDEGICNTCGYPFRGNMQ